MKILYIVSTLRLCGPINQLFGLIKYLDRDRFEPLILTLSPEPSNSISRKFQQLNVPLYSLALSRWKGVVFGANRLKSFVEKHHPDMIHTHGLRADILAANNLQIYKRITTIHNYPLADYPMKYGKIMGTITATRHFRAFRKIDLPVACSKTIQKMVKKHRINSQVVQNGVDESIYNRPTLSERLQLREKLDLPQESKIFIVVGAMIPRKQPEMVIRGFLESQAKAKGMLLIVGDGTLMDECKAIAKEFSVRFTGQINDVVSYLKAADYFISASLAEGLPYSVIEALACGLQVCLSDIEPHREILELNPEAGQLFALDNLQNLVNCLDKLSLVDTQMPSQAASAIVTEHLNAKRMSEKYQSLYQLG